MTRRAFSAGLVAIASLLLAAATVGWYARVTVLDSDRFADRAVASLRDPSVRTVIADRLTDDVVLRHRADLQTARPLISSALGGILESGAFGSLFRRAVLDAHRAVVLRDQNTIVLTLADVGTVAAAALEKVSPSVAAQVEASGRIGLLRRHLGATGGLAAAARRLRVLAWVVAALALAAAAAALATAPDRRRTVTHLGVGAIAAGVGIVVALAIVRAGVLARSQGPEQRAAAGAIWDVYLGGLRRWGWMLAGSGAVVAAAASSLLRPVAIEGTLAAAWRRATTEPARPALRLLRAVALIAAGLLVALQPTVALQVAATLAGAYLVYAGVTALLRLVAAPPEAAGARAGPRRRPSVRMLAVPVVVVVAVLAADAAFLATGGGSTVRASVAPCNGSQTLCGRPLDQVVLPATHNSMSAPLKGWFASQQDRGIGGQLEDGIRGLLIDTHYADRLANGRVRTSFASPDDLAAAVKQDGVSKESFKAAVRLRERVGFRGSGTRGMYLCHTFCELGATPLADALKDLHDFLVLHPGQVVVVVNQDYVTPADFVGAVDRAGLSPYVATPPSDGTWPTLQEMIDDDRRLVIMAENEAGAAPWYQRAYKRLLQETPYSFPNAGRLADTEESCRDNRGPADAPLLLLNNWVTTDPVPLPSNASKVNAYATLLQRVRACRRIRRRLPNLVAVDFYRRGDVFRVVDTLNGI